MPREGEPEDTSDENFEALHDTCEKIEALMSEHIAPRRVMMRGREGVQSDHPQRNLSALARLLSPLALSEYVREGVDLLPWPETSPESDLKVTF